MTTTFIDPPGPMANTSEPLDFTTDRLVTSISVEYNPSHGNGARECVFDGTNDTDATGGDFSYVYRTSTRTGTGPYTWRIVRQGKWPAELRLRVRERDPPSAGSDKAAPWQLLYTADLSLVTNQTMDAPGAYTVMGATWWRKGAAAAGQTFGAFGLGGLRSVLSGAADTRLPAGTTTPVQGFYFFPFSQLAAFNPLAPVAVTFNMFTRFTGGATTRSFAGVVNAALSGAAWNTRASQMLLGHATGNAKGHMGADGVWRDVACGFTGDNVALSHSIVRVGDIAALTHYYNGGQLFGPDQLGGNVSSGASYIFSGSYQTTPTTQGFLFGNSSNAGQQTEATLSGISIYQPKV